MVKMIGFKRHPYITISISMVALAAVLCATSLSMQDSLVRDITVNLAASAVAVIPTVIFIDKLIERHRKYRLRHAIEAAKHAMHQIRDHHLRFALTSFRYHIGAGEPETFTIDLTDDKRRKYKKALKGVLLQHDPEDIATTLTKDEWWHLSQSIARLRTTAAEYLLLYQGILESEQLGRLLAMHGAFQELDYAFNLDPDAFLKQFNEWAGDKFVNEDAAWSVYSELEARVSIALYNYLEALDKFSDEIEGVKI